MAERKSKIFNLGLMMSRLQRTTYRKTLRTRMVAGELINSLRASGASSIGGSSLGLLEADVAIAKAAAAVDVLLLHSMKE